jgi:hypothetical protein
MESNFENCPNRIASRRGGALHGLGESNLPKLTARKTWQAPVSVGRELEQPEPVEELVGTP